jgi:hypothetical protein
MQRMNLAAAVREGVDGEGFLLSKVLAWKIAHGVWSEWKISTEFDEDIANDWAHGRVFLSAQSGNNYVHNDYYCGRKVN